MKKLALIIFAACTGTNGSVLTSPPQQQYVWGEMSSQVVGVTVGGSHSCALNRDGSVVCWGDDFYGQSEVPYGAFTSITAADEHTCALGLDGTVTCWGDKDETDLATPPPGPFVSVTAGGDSTCALRSDGTAACWGLTYGGAIDAPAGAYLAISPGWSQSCGIRPGGALVCWGKDFANRGLPPVGTYAEVTSGGYRGCALRRDATAMCWGSDENFGDPPPGAFISVSQECGITVEHALTCWGGWTGTRLPTGQFIAVSAWGADFRHACAVTDTGRVACWGDDNFGQSSPPAPSY